MIDIARRFGMTSADRGSDTRIVVFEIGPARGKTAIAILADRVLSVQPVAPDEVEPAPASAFAGLARCGVSGLVRRDDALVTLLAIDALLGPDDAAVHDA